MAVAKVILNGSTLIDVTQKTVVADKLLSGYTALKNDGTDITGSYSAPSGTKSISITSNGTTTEDVTNYASAQIAVNVPTGITPSGTKSITVSGAGTITEDVTNYANAEITTPAGSEGIPYATKGAISNHTINIHPVVKNAAGFIPGGTINGTSVPVSAAELVSGTKSIIANGNNIDVTDYASVDVNVPTGGGVTVTTYSAEDSEILYTGDPAQLLSASNNPIFSCVNVEVDNVGISTFVCIGATESDGYADVWFAGLIDGLPYFVYSYGETGVFLPLSGIYDYQGNEYTGRFYSSMRVFSGTVS